MEGSRVRVEGGGRVEGVELAERWEKFQKLTRARHPVSAARNYTVSGHCLHTRLP